MIKIKKLVAAITCITMLCFVTNVQAKAESILEKTVFVDGIEYSIYVEDSTNNVIVETVGLEKNSEMIITPEGDARATIFDENSEVKEYDLEINELTEEDVEVVVKDNGNVVEEFTSSEDLQADKYVGQSVIVVGGTIVVGSLLTALLYASLALVIAGVTCYAIDAIIHVVRNTNFYYKAYRRLNTVFVNPISIPYSQAVNRIKAGADVYTYFSTPARNIVVATGLGVTPSENHRKWYSIGTFFDHYHTENRNGAHSFYGLPK
ncbi:hypothetical protein [Clostridium prolinivorans]|uniref:hypothetical protein n=1 Tax=Clostridium prolinivorans TaxID=2769420 RepID=UPI000FDC3C1B|nr:hypothetical protein [Clostridium prolinivorans]